MELDTGFKHHPDHTYSQIWTLTDNDASRSNHEQLKIVSATTESECREVDTSCDIVGDVSANRLTEPLSMKNLPTSVSTINIVCLNGTINTQNFPTVVAVPATNHSTVTQSHCSTSKPPVLSMPNRAIALHSSKEHDYDKTSTPLSKYEGLFSVEQHFVCLTCRTCFQSDSTLVLHLQIHISNLEIKAAVPSDGKKDKHALCDKMDNRLVKNAVKGGVFTKHKINGITTGQGVTNKLITTDMSKKDIDNTVPVQLRNILPLSSKDMNSVPGGNIPLKITPTLHVPVNTLSIFPGCLVVQNAINPTILATSSNVKQNIQNGSNVKSSSDINVGHSDNANIVMTENCIAKSDPQDMNAGKMSSILGNRTVHERLKERITDVDTLYRVLYQQTYKNDRPERNQPHLCEMCGKVYRMRPAYVKHIKQMHSGKPYECDKCGKLFSINSVLTRHKEKLCPMIFDLETRRRNYGKKPKEIRGEAIKCNFCMKVFHGPLLLARHQRLCAMEKTIACPVCKKLFAVQSQLKAHLKYHGERKYKCDLCPKTFLDRMALTFHRRRHTGERQHCCAQCGHRSYSKVELTRHMRLHSGEKPFTCTLCDKRFAQLTCLTNHMTTHTGERHLKCDSCLREFRSMSKLMVHKNCKHNTDHISKIFSCYHCCRIFSDSFHLKLHLKTHGPHNPYSCHICGLKCSTKNQLTQHIEIHTGNKPYTCTICRNGYLKKGDLIKHLETHSVQRIQCVICKELLAPQDVDTHMETHDRRYSCTECGESFYTQMLLTEHLKIHFGDKPHICHVCNMRFLTYARLLAHLRTHSITIIADEA